MSGATKKTESGVDHLRLASSQMHVSVSWVVGSERMRHVRRF